MNVAVVGSRNFSKCEMIRTTMDKLIDEIGEFTLVSGGADGPDKVAEKWADSRGLRKKIFPADWENGGKNAGMKRNAFIINHADMIIVFWDGESTGTLDSLKRAKRKKALKIDGMIRVYVAS